MQVQERIAQSVHSAIEIAKEIKKQIELLKERRSALISVVVTGKIDVRGVVS